MTAARKGIEMMLTDSSVPFEKRKQVLLHLATNGEKATDTVLKACLDSYGAKNGKANYAAKTKALEEMIAALEEGPVRPGTFLQWVKAAGAVGAAAKLKDRAEILLPDGTSLFALVPEPEKIGELRRGDTVLLDAQARAVIGKLPVFRRVGEQATALRMVDEHTVEVELEHQGRHVYFAGEELLRGFESGLVEPGHRVIVSPQQRMAFCGVPPEDGYTRYRFLDKNPPPDVIVERDIAAPKPFIGKLVKHIRREIRESGLGQEYRLYRCRSVFLTGVSGSGKTLNILGFTRQMYETISQETGIPLEEIPPRVLRLRASEINSKWFGQAERNVDSFFDEVEALSQERLQGPDGRYYQVPVLVVAEEIDGLTRERGSSHDVVDDRVQSTILQRLDTTSRKLRDSLVIFLCTSNVPSLLDPAFVRRAGGMVEHFGRLDRRVFEEVLTKMVQGIRFASAAGKDGRDAIADVTAWLFGANSDQGVAQIIYAGSTQTVTKRRCDFLTGALVERAVQQAAEEACQQHEDGSQDPGLSTALLQEALAEQVQNIVEHLTPHNAQHYLDVPRGSRVATVRPVTQNPIPTALERSA